jgi:hypothetical protein
VIEMNASVTFEKITSDESWKVFDDSAQRILGMGGEELIRRWDAGEFTGQSTPELMRVLMLRPSGR